MKARIPQDHPDRFNHEDMNEVVRRLGDAGWLENMSQCIVGPKGLVIHWSEKGHQRMREFHKFLKTIPPDFWKLPPGSQSPDDLKRLGIGMAIYAPEMVVPALSARGYEALFELALAYESIDPGDSDKRF